MLVKIFNRCRSRTFLAAFGLLAVLAMGSALAMEDPSVARADAVLGALARGENYVVAPEVRSDGFVREFALRTAFGTYEVSSEALMRQRIHELGALRRLQALSESDIFKQSLGRAAVAPVRYGADLINDPGRTLQRSASGIANMFNRAEAAISNRGASRDSVAGSVLGVDAARRTLAYELGIDPYTDFPPLAQRLADIAKASAAGGLVIKGMVMAIPGGAGMAVSATSTGANVREALRDNTSSQIIDRARNTLTGLGVSMATATRLVENRNYTPNDLFIIASSLTALRARNADIFVTRAAEAVARDEAYFQRRRAELLAAHGQALGILEFVAVAGFPLNRLRDGRILALFPFDELAWTDTAMHAFAGATPIARQMSGPAGIVLALPGALTPMAQQEVTKLGWTVTRLR